VTETARNQWLSRKKIENQSNFFFLYFSFFILLSLLSLSLPSPYPYILIIIIMSSVSASKAKRLAAKAAREAKSGKSSTKSSAKSTPIPSGNNSTEDLNINKLSLKVDRTATGVYTSQERSRDIKIESYSLNYFENATIELNFGRRYGLVGSNGSGKSTFLHSIAEKDIEIPDHIDVSITKWVGLGEGLETYMMID
jgi:ABC-type glutathione transport system ATPase component